MTSKDCKDCGQPMPDEDSRALWEPPTFRRLATKYAEGDGMLQDEGHNCEMGGSDVAFMQKYVGRSP